MSAYQAPGASSSLLETSRLLGRIRDGDTAAGDDLFARYRSYLEVFLNARVPRPARGLMETQDLVQEVCLRVIPRLDRFEYRGIGSFWAYLRAIALNHARAMWSKYADAREPERLPEESWLEPPANDTAPLAGLLRREQFESFERALSRLDEKRRNALLMRLELGLDLSSIARECHYPSADAARVDIHRTIERVGEAMARDG